VRAYEELFIGHGISKKLTSTIPAKPCAIIVIPSAAEESRAGHHPTAITSIDCAPCPKAGVLDALCLNLFF
jgi:hypothetical protein